jgi:hypothetical protein
MKAVIGAVALVCALGIASLAMAAGRSETLAGGKIRIFSDQSAGTAVGKILITGAIGDYGTATNIDKSGKVDQNGNFVKIALTRGGFEVDSTALNAKLNKAPGSFNKATCSFSFSGSGRVTLFNGTGLYKGLSGTANVTISFGGIGPRLTSGAKKGKCNPSQNAKPIDQYGAVIGTGVVTFR